MDPCVNKHCPVAICCVWSYCRSFMLSDVFGWLQSPSFCSGMFSFCSSKSCISCKYCWSTASFICRFQSHQFEHWYFCTSKKKKKTLLTPFISWMGYWCSSIWNRRLSYKDIHKSQANLHRIIPKLQFPLSIQCKARAIWCLQQCAKI